MLILMAAAFAVAADVPMRLLRVDSNITVYLYPHAACRVYHAGAALRMCTAKGDGACTFVQNPFAARAHAGAITRGEDAFAVPVLTDGDISIGQSVAMAAYVGEQLGFSKGIYARGGSAKGIQFMMDARDLLNNVVSTRYDRSENKLYVYGGLALPGNGPDVKAVHERFDQFLVYFEDAVIGPYFFGASPTYVDYYLVSTFQWLHILLKDYTDYGPTFPGGMLTEYPKVHSLLIMLVDGNGVAGENDSTFRAALLLP